MKRHFYVSEDLDDLDRIEQELENRGVHRPQIHVFSRDESLLSRFDSWGFEPTMRPMRDNGLRMGDFFGRFVGSFERVE